MSSCLFPMVQSTRSPVAMPKRCWAGKMLGLQSAVCFLLEFSSFPHDLLHLQKTSFSEASDSADLIYKFQSNVDRNLCKDVTAVHDCQEALATLWRKSCRAWLRV